MDSLVVCNIVNCGPIFAPFLLGAATGLVLCTVAVLLGAQYLRAHPERRFRWTRISIAIVMLLQVGQSALHIQIVLSIFGYEYGSFLDFISTRVADAAAPFIGVLLQAQAQLWLLSRAWMLSKRLALGRDRLKVVRFVYAVVIVTLCVLATVCGCAMSLELKIVGNLAVFGSYNDQSRLFFIVVPIHLGAASLVDCVLAITISAQLIKARPAIRSRLRMQQLDGQIIVLLSLFLQSGFIVAALQIGALVLWYSTVAVVTRSNNLSAWTYLPMFVLSKTYSITYIYACGLIRRLEARPYAARRSPPPTTVRWDDDSTLASVGGRKSITRRRMRLRTRTTSSEGLSSTSLEPIQISPSPKIESLDSYQSPAVPVQARRPMSVILEMPTPVSSESGIRSPCEINIHLPINEAASDDDDDRSSMCSGPIRRLRLDKYGHSVPMYDSRPASQCSTSTYSWIQLDEDAEARSVRSSRTRTGIAL